MMCVCNCVWGDMCAFVLCSCVMFVVCMCVYSCVYVCGLGDGACAGLRT